MSEPRPYAKMGGAHAGRVDLLRSLAPSAMSPEQDARCRERVASLAGSAPPPRRVPGASLALGALAAILAASATAILVAPAASSPPPVVAAPPVSTAMATAASDPLPTVSAYALPDAISTTVASPDLGPKRSAASAPQAVDDGLLRELRLVDAAKHALEQGQAERALDTLEEHRTAFGNGQLRSEREVLSVEALCALGRRGEAEKQARSLQEREPGSPYARRALAALAAERSREKE